MDVETSQPQGVLSVVTLKGHIVSDEHHNLFQDISCKWLF